MHDLSHMHYLELSHECTVPVWGGNHWESAENGEFHEMVNMNEYIIHIHENSTLKPINNSKMKGRRRGMGRNRNHGDKITLFACMAIVQ